VGWLVSSSPQVSKFYWIFAAMMPQRFNLYEFLATVLIILLTVSPFGFVSYSARKFGKLGFMLRFKSVVIVGVLTMLVPVFAITIGVAGSEPLWQFA
jgi:hypothetical protein